AEIALDDFGLGYSSLGYLRTLPVNYLKIPGHFVRQLLTNPVDQALVESICKLAERTGMQTIAEGVEDEATLCLLRTLGCDHVQGYYLHRPEPWPVSSPPLQTGILRFPVRYRAH
ncbi:MAG: EAL domain-containing protein, partial [Gammaproteobacteria bacterium]